MCAGQFNLDPNRVVDVILECFEQRRDDGTFIAEVLNDQNYSFNLQRIFSLSY